MFHFVKYSYNSPFLSKLLCLEQTEQMLCNTITHTHTHTLTYTHRLTHTVIHTHTHREREREREGGTEATVEFSMLSDALQMLNI